MIRRLRRFHFVAVLGLIVPLPGLLGAAYVTARRQPVPVMPLPRQLLDGSAGAISGLDALEPDGPLQWSVRLSEDGSAIDVRPSRDLQEPDLLVYWTASSGPFEDLPEEARLLGVLAGTSVRRFPLPERVAQSRDGALIVYSLAHADLVATIPLAEAQR